MKWRTPRACHRSSRISFIDDHGGFHYEDDCTYMEHSQKVSLDATLREPMPASAEHSSGCITLVGKLDAVGPQWKLTDAIVADTRFTE